MEILFTTDELAERWKMNPQTLKRFRKNQEGPKYLKIESSIRYRLSDIEEYEKSREVA